MDFIKNLLQRNSLGNLQSSGYHISTSRKYSVPTDDPIEIIEKQIKHLININLSPLPINREDVQIQQNEISSCLRQIVFHFDVIFSHKLKTPNQEHYWSFISKCFHNPSVKFVENFKKLRCDSEKGVAWILVSILENSFKEHLKEAYKQSLDIKYYQSESLIIKHKYELLNIVENLSKLIVLFKTNQLSIFRDFVNFKSATEEEAKRNKESSEKLESISPIKKWNKMKLSRENTQNNFNNSNNLIILNTPVNIALNPQKTKSFNGLSTTPYSENQKTLDNLLNIINKETTLFVEENPQQIEDRHENIEEYSSGEDEWAQSKQQTEKLTAKKSLSTDNNNNLSLFRKLSDVTRNNQISKMLYKEDKVRNLLSDRFQVLQYMEFQNCFKENFFFVNNVNNRQQVGNILTAKQNYPIDKYITIVKKEKSKFTPKDRIFIKEIEARMTNSLLFYLNNYYNKAEYFKFNTSFDRMKRPMRLEAQNNQCQLCRKIFNRILNVPFTKVNWCSYYNRFLCKDCLAEEYSIIPSFVIKYWNFDKFPISKEALELLKKWYDKPVIYIKNSDKLLTISSKFTTASLIKRKIHKIFDLMKCENHDEIANEILGKYNYLVLKEIYFSLKDLKDINDGNLIEQLKGFLQRFEDHILKECKVCNYKGGQCMMCLSDEVLIAYNIENVFYCSDCRKMFHKKCSQFHPCYINKLEM